MAHVHAPKLSWLALATAAAAASAPVQAQTVPSAAGAASSWSKSDAILGGMPSALQAILAQQSGLPAPQITPRPASYSLANTSAIVRKVPAVSLGVTSGRPDVFGSVALKIQRAPLMARWRKVEPARLGGASARYAQSLADIGEVERLEAVNRYVNDRVTFVDDRKQYGQVDVWSAAADTLSRGRGDCEDYAIAKLQVLRAAGIADRDLYLTVVRDLVRRSDHAVLVVRAGNRMLLLDNGIDAVLDADSVADYRPMLTFAATGSWTHGYRRATPALTLAAAEEAAGDQRSRSASLLAFNTGLSK